MLDTLDTTEMRYLVDNLGHEELVTYCTLHKESIERISSVLTQAEQEQLLSDVAKQQGQHDVDAFDAAQKELVRAIYRLKRETITESERITLLRPFFPEMTQRYADLLAENIPDSQMMTFDRLLVNVEKLYATGIAQAFDDWKDSTFLDRGYLERYVVYVKDSEAFRHLVGHEPDSATDLLRKYAGKVESSTGDMEKAALYRQKMGDALNIILLAIYLEQDAKAYFYMDPDELNMYQGFEMEMDIEEALDALYMLKEAVERQKVKRERRRTPWRYLRSLLGR